MTTGMLRAGIPGVLGVLLLACGGSVKPNRSYNQGVILFESGHYGEAKATLHQAVRESPDDDQAYYLLGLTEDRLNSPREAIDHIEKAIRLRPREAAYHCAAGILYHTLRYPDKARDSLLEAVRLDPRDPRYRISLGRFELESGHSQAAVVQFEKALEISPANQEAQDLLAKAREDLTSAR